ncbi:bacteriorhodopsin [Rubricoccus marinus]|uniref:Rhodopsin n=1 Tax=Rubricoccus marinus TaxID=716817 RepID=A0A259U296_9BACT|nr:bacteriorhodopsin [Rubricoccus marinus]OZC04119.1 rhodopsin [Rubricoccus marinus]
MAQTWYWIGLVAMAVGSGVFGVAAARAPERRWQILWTLYFFICLIAAVLYLVMATGFGSYVSADGTKTTWVRYVTWFTSTPLLLLALTYLGRSSMPLVASLLGANAFMIATGFVATILPEDALSLTWWAISTGAYVAIAWAFLGRYKREAKAALPASGAVFDRIVLVHLILWTAYPVVWMLSPEGLDLVGDGPEALMFTILDIAAKVGFGFLAANSLRQIEQNGEAAAFEPGAPAVVASGVRARA